MFSVDPCGEVHAVRRRGLGIDFGTLMDVNVDTWTGDG